ELGRRLVALRLVGRVFVVAEAAVQVAVEGHTEMGGLLVGDELQEEARETVDRPCPLAVRALDGGGEREVGAEDVRAGVDQVGGGRCGHRRNVAGLRKRKRGYGPSAPRRPLRRSPSGTPGSRAGT